MATKRFYPILLIFLSFSSSMILIFRPSMVISRSVAKLDNVRMALEVVIFDRLAKSSRERYVSTAYARKLAPYVGKFHTVKPNRMELEILAGQEIKDELSLYNACETVLNKGLHRIFVSLGTEGCLYMDQEGRMLRRKLKPCEHMVNATGAGDAFTAAMIYATLEQLPIESVMDYAMAAGIAAIGHERTINPQMSISLLESILKEYKQ